MRSAQLVAGTSSRRSSPFDSHKTARLRGHAMRQPSFSTNVTCLSGFRVESRRWWQNTQSSGSVNVVLVWRVPRQKVGNASCWAFLHKENSQLLEDRGLQEISSSSSSAYTPTEWWRDILYCVCCTEGTCHCSHFKKINDLLQVCIKTEEVGITGSVWYWFVYYVVMKKYV